MSYAHIHIHVHLIENTDFLSLVTKNVPENRSCQVTVVRSVC
jgi:hypothetical protein